MQQKCHNIPRMHHSVELVGVSMKRNHIQNRTNNFLIPFFNYTTYTAIVFTLKLQKCKQDPFRSKQSLVFLFVRQEDV